jgi:hypothetical protein
MFANPLDFCLSIYVFSAGVVRVISISREASKSCGMILMMVSSLLPL